MLAFNNCLANINPEYFTSRDGTNISKMWVDISGQVYNFPINRIKTVSNSDIS